MPKNMDRYTGSKIIMSAASLKPMILQARHLMAKVVILSRMVSERFVVVACVEVLLAMAVAGIF